MAKDTPKRSYGLRDIFDLVESFDLFGTSIPSFHVAGSDQVRTKTGSLLSIGLIGITLLFALMKLKSMISRAQPNINVFEDKGALSEEDRLDPTDDKF